MQFLKKPWFIALVLTLVLFVGVQYYIKAQGTEATTLSAQEIRSQIEEMYDGEIIAFASTGDSFEATLAKEGAEYALEGSAASGEVYSLIQTKEVALADASEKEEAEKKEEQDKEKDNEIEEVKDEPKEENKEEPKAKPKEEDKPKTEQPAKPKEQPKKEEPKKEEPKKEAPKKQTRISSQEAGQIGLSRLPSGLVGELDDIEFESSDQGGHYWVEIEIDDDDDDDIEFDEVTFKIHAITGEVLLTEWDD